MIKITDKYFLDADSNCYMLKEKVVIKDKESKNFGEEDFRPLKYYTTIESALRGIINLELKKFVGKNKIQELDDLVKKIDKLNSFFNKKLKEVK